MVKIVPAKDKYGIRKNFTKIIFLFARDERILINNHIYFINIIFIFYFSN